LDAWIGGSLKIDIDKLTEEQLVDLNHRIVARLKFLREARSHSAMLEFRIGDRVSFNPEGRAQLVGIVTKYNRKTVTVITEGGEHWNVSPMLLRRAVAAVSQSASPNVVPIKRE
jgi:hypothetical protein